MGRPRKEKKSLADRVMEIDPVFAAAVQTMDTASLKNELYKMAKYRVEIEEARSLDEELASAKEQLKVLGETYSEPLKAIRMKSKLAVDFLKSKREAPEGK